MATITLREIVTAVRDPGNKEDHPEHYVRSAPRVDAVVDEIEAAVTDALGARTLRDLVVGDG
jgi:DNA-binding IscR family transcriptional regulator